MNNYMCNKMRKADQFLQEKTYKRGILSVLMKVNFVQIKSCVKKNPGILVVWGRQLHIRV